MLSCENSSIALAVLAHHAIDDGAAAAGREVDVASGDLDARRHPLDVPLPRPGQRLVEVVGPEQQVTIRSREPAEVRDVRVSARLHDEPRRRRPGEVASHHRRRSPIERERRHEHSPVPDRDQLREPRLGLNTKGVHGIRAVWSRRPLAVARARRRLSRLPAAVGILAVLQPSDPHALLQHAETVSPEWPFRLRAGTRPKAHAPGSILTQTRSPLNIRRAVAAPADAK